MIQGNAKQARLIIEEFVRCGINQFVIAPGFRSAPLALAAVSHPDTQVEVHYDERGSAFFALGYGRATRKPCVWITTSGTATANGFPAVVESSMDDVPLICLTADRPSELRDTGANQTINQVHLFGHYPRWFADLSSPTQEVDDTYIRATIDYAVFRAHAGPVHLNCMFREPLLEMEDPAKSIPSLRWAEPAPPQTNYISKEQGSPEFALGDHLVQTIRDAERGIIVVGRLQTSVEGSAIHDLGAHLGWPILPDICAPMHASEVMVNFFNLILRSNSFVRKHAPDVILHFGGPFVSKELQKYLTNASPKTYALIDPSSSRVDPACLVTDRLQVIIDSFCNELIRQLPPNCHHSSWLQTWMNTDAIVQKSISQALTDELSEPSLVWELSHLIDGKHWFFGASSMPIRDLQTFFLRGSQGNPRVFANRGASGIDGTLATAAGIAKTTTSRGTVLIGDLAMLHDLNSLNLIRNCNVTVIVVNNNGGGIFHMLPIALGKDEFERVLGTPHGLNFQSAAKQFQIPYTLVQSLNQFRDTWRSSTTSSGAHVIEVQTDRDHNAKLHEELYRIVTKKVQVMLEC